MVNGMLSRWVRVLVSSVLFELVGLISRMFDFVSLMLLFFWWFLMCLQWLYMVMVSVCLVWFWLIMYWFRILRILCGLGSELCVDCVFFFSFLWMMLLYSFMYLLQMNMFGFVISLCILCWFLLQKEQQRILLLFVE